MAQPSHASSSPSRPASPLKRFALWLAQSIYGSIEIGGKVLGSLSVIVGVLYGALEYNRTKIDKQVEQTFAMLRQFDADPYTSARERIEVALSKHNADIVAAAVDVKKLEAILAKVIVDEKIDKDLTSIIHFYDELVYCIVSNYCDASRTYDLFYPDARLYYTTFYTFIVSTRRDTASDQFGAGLATLATVKTPSK
jgi:hypothetical protein